MALAEQLGDELLDVELRGDGAGSLVDVWAARHEDGTIDVLVWNGTLDQSKAAGSPLLARRVSIHVEGKDVTSYDAMLARVDAEHSNIASAWDGQTDWPSEAGWRRLREADRLDERPVGISASGEVVLDLPMPGIARLRIGAPTGGTPLRSML